MDPLYDVLAPHLPPSATSSPANTARASSYLTHLSTLSLSDLTTAEPAELLRGANSHIRNLQALSKRSHKAVISSSAHLTNLSSLLLDFSSKTTTLHEQLPALENAATDFAKKYDRSGDNEVLESRKRALLLSRNVDRVSDVLDLPTLFSSTVSAAQQASSSTTSYASALDLHAHIRRLNGLYPTSPLVASISTQAETEMRNLTTILITTLQSPGLKLAAAIRTIGWLRRVAPELTETIPTNMTGHVSTKSFDPAIPSHADESALATLFLISRLHTLHSTLEALAPLRELADQESPTSAGSHSERYLKRHLEIFREQSFNIVSMYKSIFPHSLPSAESSVQGEDVDVDAESLGPLPSPLASFSLHLTDSLTETLQRYLPNITDKGARESLLTQVLYCAGSLGRLGGDFGMVVPLLGEDLGSEDGDGEEESEWVRVMRKHRVQAGRLEVLARGVGTGGRKGSAEVRREGAEGRGEGGAG